MFNTLTIALAAALAVAFASTALADNGKRKVYRTPSTVTEGRNTATVPGFSAAEKAQFDRASAPSNAGGF